METPSPFRAATVMARVCLAALALAGTSSSVHAAPTLFATVTNATLNGVNIFSTLDIANNPTLTNAPIVVTTTNIDLVVDAFYQADPIDFLSMVVTATDAGGSTATLTPEPGVPPFGINYTINVGDSATNAARTAMTLQVGGGGIWTGVLDFYTASPFRQIDYSLDGSGAIESNPRFEITLIVVPEPATALALAGACVPLLARRRRR